MLGINLDPEFKSRPHYGRYKSTKNPQTPCYQCNADYLSDLGWIQTSNLLSRNQVRYSVAPRGLYSAANIAIIG